MTRASYTAILVIGCKGISTGFCTLFIETEKMIEIEAEAIILSIFTVFHNKGIFYIPINRDSSSIFQ